METSQQISQGTASQGVVLMAFGRHTYYGAAYNLAYSIRRYSGDVNITCIIEFNESVTGQINDLADICDAVIEIKPEHLFTNGKIDPGKAKVFLYDYLPYEHNIYLDVDAVALKDIRPMMNELIALNKPYASHIMGYHTLDKGNKIESMVWAFADDIWKRYNLDESATLPAINSSIQYIRISEEAKALYQIAQNIYVHNPIPVKELRFKWGGGQPDELYMNVALAKLGIDPAAQEYVHITTKRGPNFAQVINEYYLQSYFGGQGFTPLFYTDWLDRMLRSWFKEEGKLHKYPINRIIANKHADPKR